MFLFSENLGKSVQMFLFTGNYFATILSAVFFFGIFWHLCLELNQIMNMNKIVSKDSFLAPFLEKQTIDETDPKWQEFLTDCAVEKTAEKYPLLLKKIEDTPLSARARKCLLDCDVYTVADLAAHSIPELRMIPSLGEKTVKEIEAYMKEVLRS